MRVAAAAELEWTGFNKNVMEVCIVPVPFTWKYNMHSLAAPCKWLQSTKKHHSMHPLSNQMYHWPLFTEHGRCTNTCFKYFQTKSPTTWVHTQSLRLGALLALISTFTVSREQWSYSENSSFLIKKKQWYRCVIILHKQPPNVSTQLPLGAFSTVLHQRLVNTSNMVFC